MKTFSVKDFQDFQHYRDRPPIWIKLYNKLLDDYEFAALPDSSKWHLVAIWLLASRYNNQIPLDSEWVARRINATSHFDLDALFHAGFLEENQDVADRKQDASTPLALARSREREKIKEEKKENCANSLDQDASSKRNSPSMKEQFEDWYSDYPQKKDRGKAEKAFKAALKKTDLETLKAGLARYKQSKPDWQAWAYPATWLNGERWLDEEADPSAQGGTAGNGSPEPQDQITLKNYNTASRAAVVAKVERYFLRNSTNWNSTGVWSDKHPPGHPECVIPDDIVNEVRAKLQANSNQNQDAA